MSMLSVAVNRARAVNFPTKPVDSGGSELASISARLLAVEQALAQFIHKPPVIGSNTISKVKRLVCETYGLTDDDLVSPQRNQKISHPRHIAIYLCLKYTKMTLPGLARHFGNRDHSTIINSRDRITNKRKTDAALNRELLELEASMERA